MPRTCPTSLQAFKVVDVRIGRSLQASRVHCLAVILTNRSCTCAMSTGLPTGARPLSDQDPHWAKRVLGSCIFRMMPLSKVPRWHLHQSLSVYWRLTLLKRLGKTHLSTRYYRGQPRDTYSAYRTRYRFGQVAHCTRDVLMTSEACLSVHYDGHFGL